MGQWGMVRRNALPRRTDVLLFAAATAAICHCYSDSNGRHRDVFRSKYLNVLDFILGNTGELLYGCCSECVSEDTLVHLPFPRQVVFYPCPQIVWQTGCKVANIAACGFWLHLYLCICGCHAGIEHGKLKHVPSTSDLLGAALPPSIAAEARRAASDLGAKLQVPCARHCT